ncbi:alpha/beta fold hydrolase [Halarcobacter ebronensis]|uniref:Alpha/beta hydrolase n=1 Tax=Halarcobacter ebronensis TaxID=1462615 RepID=A0A4Q1AEC3_9BACT|nr:alpha/beta hydrolase [Halarcobacter ebronensis]QKF81224.1 alpha/beta hydrolase family protein [Halarcobacter ebronensis]RXK01787.1 alpha/beta hydrolase [Halarcobacter ebronensis]
MLFPNIFKEESIEVNGVKINFKHTGIGKPLLLIHGYPQTHIMWHKIAPTLANSFYIVCPDLRGYGKSSKPKGLENHENYSKKNMAKDMVELMNYLGFDKFFVAGHDRGARVTHRLCLDYPNQVLKACVMDIAPTFHMFENTDQIFATGYYHWFFLIQPDNLPETMIEANPEYYLKEKLKRWSAKDVAFEKKFDSEALDEYVKCFDKESIHATCEDYRAAATIDMSDDRKDRNRKIDTPLLVLWGAKGFINRTYKVLDVWSEYATKVSGKALDCGHFLPEEKPLEVIDELERFFK